ncbi:acyl-CoA dehydrogenase [Litorimonas sp.]|uniref:acyl-CoA dehydrogenase n=1 Tax=Litorimonas sp. TaxID=1892381 RepID=UPI003A85AC86
MTFHPPKKAMQFLLNHSVDMDRLRGLPQFEEAGEDLINDVLTGAAAFSSDVIAPTNWGGDQNPAKLNGDDVTASPGFKEAYKAFVEGGWQTLATPVEIGGMGLPSVVSVATNEMIYASNMSFGLCPMLTSSAAKAINAHASAELQDIYLSKMVTGEWSGAMCLTEPQAGSDLGPVRTKAVDNGDGTYAISGQKIYITWGDHDCAENIIHLVLARLPDSPEGSRGISLFLCPKYFVNEDGTLGDRNKFKPIGLEHKLGIHGSPTCTMEFDGATGWLVGEVNRGLACMFTMMNEARLFVGVQGVAIGERAYQAALDYANERVQGVPIEGEAGEPILGHPDVRRMLVEMKTRLMGARAIAMATAAASDLASASQDETAAKSAHAREALLTPIIKSYGSDTGVQVASIGIQVHGGMGFVEETGAAQHYRDARIAPIYEGTNGIQAIDLVGRKLRRDGGEAMKALIEDLKQIQSLVEETSSENEFGLSACAKALSEGIENMSAATDALLKADDKDALSVAMPYLNLCASVISGAFLIKSVLNGAKAGDELTASMASLARYHAVAIMPEAQALLGQIQAGASAVFDFPESQLADL